MNDNSAREIAESGKCSLGEHEGLDKIPSIYGENSGTVAHHGRPRALHTSGYLLTRLYFRLLLCQMPKIMPVNACLTGSLFTP